MTLAQQRAFFETFGFLKLPGLLRPGIDAITAEFEAVFPQLRLNHDGSVRTSFVPFVDQRPGLCSLLDHPGLLAAVGNLIGADFNYVSSDGNFYSGETTWHHDSNYPAGGYIKVAFYLDGLTRDTGCLRVLPGSHREEIVNVWNDDVLRASPMQFGMEQRDLPAYPIETEPGDVLVFNHRLRHASFGGGDRRRMFTMNLGRRAVTPQEIDDLIAYVAWHWCAHAETPYAPAMLATATPARKIHLTQPPQYWEAGVERRRAHLEKSKRAAG